MFPITKVSAGTLKRLVIVIAVLGLLGLWTLSTTGHQVAQPSLAHAAGPERVAALAGARQIQDRLDHLQQLVDVSENLKQRLGRAAEKMLSSGGLQLITLGERLETIRGALSHRPGSDPSAAEDFLSRLAGMTQSETSVAWCGSNAVIGFNDSGSFVGTLLGFFSPSNSFSFNGWSRSSNAGGTFKDLGALVADPLPAGVAFHDLFGDPVLGCTDSATFYYASLAIETGSLPIDSLIPSGVFSSGISVSKSTNGGASWGGAVMAVREGAPTHFLDKPWMAVAPGPTSSPGDDVIHVTYTDFDFSGDVCGFDADGFPILRTAIEYVQSVNGGATWSTPLVIDQVCGFEFLQGSQVEVGLGSDVYVAWEHYAADFVTREIRISKSTNGGSSFGAPVVVQPVTPVGDSFVLQGNFRAFLDFQGLAVDRSAGPNTGNVYITWHDGRNRSAFDPFGFCDGGPTYCFGDIFLTRSVDGGAHWSTPIRVNNDHVGAAVDQFMPAVEVDSTGSILVFFYDRRRDARNFRIDTFLARSVDGGSSWSNSRVTSTNFPPITGWEDVVVNPFYMGDYIGIAVDATQAQAGVVLAWGDNSLGDANVLFGKR